MQVLMHHINGGSSPDHLPGIEWRAREWMRGAPKTSHKEVAGVQFAEIYVLKNKRVVVIEVDDHVRAALVAVRLQLAEA